MIDYWHNPRCSKSRQGLALLQERGAQIAIRRYLDDAPSPAELAAVWEALGKPPATAMMRTADAAFRAAGLEQADDARLLAAMAANPALIERPIAIRGNRAVIGRPPERLLDLL